jgi:hypothetical protein
MREQVELTFIIGYAASANREFEAACIAAATRLCGGCFVADGTGYWRAGSDRRAQRFDGEQMQERTLCVRLTTELAKEAEVLRSMRQAITRAAVAHGMLDVVQWVHVQRHAITGLHFAIGDELARAA